ncbi:NADPH-dependent 7-cyano-7-deazaguanine reductase QueF [Motiliproteus sediminis]|uniref:NADPH-dependent 7-cyano-7-deazaguanine reductase QueF n=1 Tax=Motiliproteus sediminis TaxID=1468178 RepID=UPI001AEFED98|nr:NADPH-dependent 7-cyano-7-deazaguanine reductase QueF [Motiliproteus sediminis]
MSQKPHIEQSPLGRSTPYVSQYDPGQLHPIPRATPWQQQGFESRPFTGVDIWNGYEISWLSEQGMPRVAWAEFRIPADSPHLIESKSFKLYLNSFNLSRFADRDQVAELMGADLSACAGSPVEVTLRDVDDAEPVGRLAGDCLDDQDLSISHYHPAPELLVASDDKVVEEQLYSHLLKSNCPVTGQPDWASVQIGYRGPKIDRGGLLAYLISYREHGDFHEQCVEQIFLDLLARCRPESLTVYARYVRRGGLDINPCRSTESGVVANTRLGRQ